MIRIVSESEFCLEIYSQLSADEFRGFKFVTGPGRSGAIASVYASHFLSLAFVPYGHIVKNCMDSILIIDTATDSGATLRKASRKYESMDHMTHAVYNEPPRVKFWYEEPKVENMRALLNG